MYEIKNNGQCNKRGIPGRGFGWFLSNSFAARARSQMLDALVQNKIFTSEEAEYLLECSKNPVLRESFVNQ